MARRFRANRNQYALHGRFRSICLALLLTALPLGAASPALAASPAAVEFEVDGDVTTELDLAAIAGAGWTVVSTGAANYGTVAVTPAGTLLYTPDPGFTGVDQFSYTATGPGGERIEGGATVYVFAESSFAPEPPGAEREPSLVDWPRSGPPADAAEEAEPAAPGFGWLSGLHPWRHVVRVGLIAGAIAVYFATRKKAPTA